ncbi:MAG TPA: hypothetical protein VK638_47535, partial [Edaphobacter sp.]|nr:hypothetical protein [Edaphobacter sp.]
LFGNRVADLALGNGAATSLFRMEDAVFGAWRSDPSAHQKEAPRKWGPLQKRLQPFDGGAAYPTQARANAPKPA